jgi:hypothetical protein
MCTDCVHGKSLNRTSPENDERQIYSSKKMKMALLLRKKKGTAYVHVHMSAHLLV